jgi:predicted dehydrogenase
VKKPLRVLFYGTTHEHAPGKFESLRTMPEEFEIAAVVDDAPRGSPMFRDYPWQPSGCPVVMESEAWSVPDIDVVFVEATNRDLIEIAAEAAARSLPMHCDKPCGEDMDAYRKVVEMCRAKNIPMQIGYMYRANPAVAFCRKAVREGWLGEVRFVEADMNHAYNHDNYAEYISTFKGGILYNLGCHLVDMVEPLVEGLPRGCRTVLRSAPFDAPGSKTCGVSLLEFPSADVVIRTSSQMPGGILHRRLRIDGSNGTIDLCPIERFDGERLKLVMTLQKSAGGYAAGRHEIDFGVQGDRYAGQLRELAQIVRGELANDPGQYDRDLKVHEITLMMAFGGDGA